MANKDNDSKDKRPSWLVKLIAAIGAAVVFLSNCVKGIGPGIGNGLGLIGSGGAQQAMEGSAVAGSEARSALPETGEQPSAETAEETAKEPSEGPVKETAEETPEETPEETAPEIRITIVDVTVTEDGYIFQNSKCGLEEIITGLNEGDEIHMTDDNASKKNVDALKAAAKEKSIKIVEVN